MDIYKCINQCFILTIYDICDVLRDKSVDGIGV